MILGVIADDFTGATDVASMLVRAGMRTVQVIGVPDGPAPPADAVVVALKSRTIAPEEAVRQSLQALRWLQLTMDSLVTRQRGDGIYAGLPWFNEYWGRDSFISLPGATLVTGHFDEARAILVRQRADLARRGAKRIGRALCCGTRCVTSPSRASSST